MNKILYCALFFCLLVEMTVSTSAQTWTSQTPPTTQTLRAIYFINSNEGWSAGYNGIIHTTNGGSNWSSQVSNFPYRLIALRFVDANYGWANAGLKVLRSENGGTTWHDMTGLDPNAAIFRNVIFPVSSTVAWATAQGGGYRWFYRYTATSATAVTEQTFGLITSGVQLLDLWFVDQDNGWAVGIAGQIWKITNASTESPGFTNQTNTDVTGSTLRGVFFLNANNGWSVGDGGTIIKTTDGGSNWSALASGTTTNLKDVYFADTNNGCVVGENGLIRKTTDGGVSWSTLTSGVTTTLWSVFYLGSVPGFIAGGDLSTSGNGTILRTDNALPVQLTSFTAAAHGHTVKLLWRTETEVNSYSFQIERRMERNASESWQIIGTVAGSGTNNSPQEYSFHDHKLNPGRYSYRLKHINFDGSFKYYGNGEVEVFAPSVFALEQNYPNPFNPSTTISFSLPYKSFVSLSVFDALGREVSTLLSEEFSEGSYTRQWNAANMPSGVYFIRMQAGSFTATKKLILLE